MNVHQINELKVAVAHANARVMDLRAKVSSSKANWVLHQISVSFEERVKTQNELQQALSAHAQAYYEFEEAKAYTKKERDDTKLEIICRLLEKEGHQQLLQKVAKELEGLGYPELSELKLEWPPQLVLKPGEELG